MDTILQKSLLTFGVINISIDGKTYKSSIYNVEKKHFSKPVFPLGNKPKEGAFAYLEAQSLCEIITYIGWSKMILVKWQAIH